MILKLKFTNQVQVKKVYRFWPIVQHSYLQLIYNKRYRTGILEIIKAILRWTIIFHLLNKQLSLTKQGHGSVKIIHIYLHIYMYTNTCSCLCTYIYVHVNIHTYMFISMYNVFLPFDCGLYHNGWNNSCNGRHFSKRLSN